MALGDGDPAQPNVRRVLEGQGVGLVQRQAAPRPRAGGADQNGQWSRLGPQAPQPGDEPGGRVTVSTVVDNLRESRRGQMVAGPGGGINGRQERAC